MWVLVYERTLMDLCVNVHNVTKIGVILYPIYGHKECLQEELIVFLKNKPSNLYIRSYY